MAGAAKALPVCPVETALTLISDKRKALIPRNLLLGTKRFGELKKRNWDTACALFWTP